MYTHSWLERVRMCVFLLLLVNIQTTILIGSQFHWCNETNTCAGLQIECFAEECTVMCNGVGSYLNSTIDCGEDTECTAYCNTRQSCQRAVINATIASRKGDQQLNILSS